jgi:hypothetical protein
MRTLSRQDVNRALLARQLLLERGRMWPAFPATGSGERASWHVPGCDWFASPCPQFRPRASAVTTSKSYSLTAMPHDGAT